MNRIYEILLKSKLKQSFSKSIPKFDDKERLICNNCDFINYSNPKVVSGVIASYKDKILLCKRSINPKYGYWCLPAGFLESGESPEIGAIREAKEECCCDINIISLLSIYSVPYIDQIMIYYRGNILNNGYYNIGTECLDVKLFDKDEIPWDKLAFPVVEKSLKFYFNNNQNTNNFDTFTFQYTNLEQYNKH